MKRSLIALTAIVITTAALAQPRPGGGPGPGRDGGPRPGGPRPGAPRQVLSPADLATFLGLSDAQQTQAQQLRETLKATIEPLLAQQRANHDAIRTAVDAGNAEAAGAAMIANDKLRDQIKAAHDAHKASFEAMLTADQKAKWAVLQEIGDLRRDRPGRPGE